MLNNRLEDLIYLYRVYRKKRILKISFFIIGFLFLTSLIFSSFYFFKTKKNEQNQTKIVIKKPQLEKKQIKEKNISIKTKEPKISEEKFLKLNILKTLLILEKQKPSYQTAYDIAKYFYEHKLYQKAARWAFIATNRDSKQADAWILYAKSKIKLGQKGIAKKALKIYLLKYKSKKVTTLLNSI